MLVAIAGAASHCVPSNLMSSHRTCVHSVTSRQEPIACRLSTACGQESLNGVSPAASASAAVRVVCGGDESSVSNLGLAVSRVMREIRKNSEKEKVITQREKNTFDAKEKKELKIYERNATWGLRSRIKMYLRKIQDKEFKKWLLRKRKLASTKKRSELCKRNKNLK